jgi:Flp pilus assembly pilin Flp
MQQGGERALMKCLIHMFVRSRESGKGQTMTEYVLIIAAIAVAGYTAYVGLEGGINGIIANVTATLAAA